MIKLGLNTLQNTVDLKLLTYQNLVQKSILLANTYLTPLVYESATISYLEESKDSYFSKAVSFAKDQRSKLQSLFKTKS